MLNAEKELLTLLQTALYSPADTIYIPPSLDTMFTRPSYGVTHSVTLAAPFKEAPQLLTKLQHDGYIQSLVFQPSGEIECSLTYRGLHWRAYRQHDFWQKAGWRIFDFLLGFFSGIATGVLLAWLLGILRLPAP